MRHMAELHTLKHEVSAFIYIQVTKSKSKQYK